MFRLRAAAAKLLNSTTFRNTRTGLISCMFDYCTIDNSECKNVSILSNTALPYLGHNKRQTI